MKALIPLRMVSAIVALLLVSPLIQAADGKPEDAVTAFNTSISAKDLEGTIAALAEGGAQFTLRAQHAEAAPDKLQSEIKGYWTTIAPVVFATTSSYKRLIEITDTRTDGDIATVWTNTRTESTRLKATDAQVNEFSETYLVIRTAGGWKIAAIADNRQATKLEDGE